MAWAFIYIPSVIGIRCSHMRLIPNFLELAYKFLAEPSSTYLLFNMICTGSGETERICCLAWFFAARICDLIPKFLELDYEKMAEHREEQPQNTNRRKTVKASNHALSSSTRWLQNKKEHSVMHKKTSTKYGAPTIQWGNIKKWINNNRTTALKGTKVGLSLHLHRFFFSANSKGCGDIARMCRLIWPFVARNMQ